MADSVRRSAHQFANGSSRQSGNMMGVALTNTFLSLTPMPKVTTLVSGGSRTSARCLSKSDLVANLSPIPSRGRVVLDSNAVDGALANPNSLRGRTPIVPITAAKEYLRGPGTSGELRGLLQSNGGRIGLPARESLVVQLRAQAAQMGRVLRTPDARVAGSAIRERAPLLTADNRLRNFMRQAGFQVEGFQP